MRCVIVGAKISEHSLKSFVGMMLLGDVLSWRLLMMFLVVSVVIGLSEKFGDFVMFKAISSF